MGDEQGRGQLILILGIVGLVCCMPCGIAAWIMGAGDMKKIAAGQIPETERSFTQIGMILGIISVVLVAIAVVGWVLMFVLAMGTAAVGG